MKTLKSFMGPRGGITPAVDAIWTIDKTMPKKQLHLYIWKCAQGPAQKTSARIHRKHGVFPSAEQARKIESMRYEKDKLSRSAIDTWLSCNTPECISFPSPYGGWTERGAVPFGGYFSAMNPGYNRNPRR